MDLAQDIKHHEDRVDLGYRRGKLVIEGWVTKVAYRKLCAWVEREYGACRVTAFRCDGFDDTLKHQLAHVKLEVQDRPLDTWNPEYAAALSYCKRKLKRKVGLASEGGTAKDHEPSARDEGVEHKIKVRALELGELVERD
jgi:hypothetical protein